jgi:DNA-entry nuclease
MRRIFALSLALLLLFSAAATEELPAMEGAFCSALDGPGRAGTALALLSPDTLDASRGSVSSLMPTGCRETWYDEIAGGYLWNRCHLIGAQLARGTERIENLVTGTRDMNVMQMLPVENRVAEYIARTGNHVLYRVTPDFRDNELVCRGVTISAWSMEDDALRFTVYCANTQPGIEIDYAYGFSSAASDAAGDMYVINTKSLRFHLPSCQGSQQMADKNRQVFHGDRETLIRDGYIPCGTCRP